MSRESRLSFKNQGALPQTLQALVWSELCFAKWLRHRIIFRTLLRKAVCDRRIFLCGSLVKAFCYAKRSIVKILLRKTAYSELCFAKWSSTTAFIFAVHWSELCYAKRSTTAASWSKHFATQNGLRPPRFLRGAYFAVHCFDSNF